MSSKFFMVPNLTESWICKDYFRICLNMGQFASLIPEHVSVNLNVPQYVWTWLNIAEYPWIFLNMSKKLLWLYCGSQYVYVWIYLKAQNVPGFWIYHVSEQAAIMITQQFCTVLNILECAWIIRKIPKYHFIYLLLYCIAKYGKSIIHWW